LKPDVYPASLLTKERACSLNNPYCSWYRLAIKCLLKTWATHFLKGLLYCCALNKIVVVTNDYTTAMKIKAAKDLLLMAVSGNSDGTHWMNE